jgi:hypothetical protein
VGLPVCILFQLEKKKVNYISVFFCQVCPQIGLCPPAESVVALDPTHVVNDKPSCPLCLLATQSIIDKLKDNKTEVRGSLITLVEVRPHCCDTEIAAAELNIIVSGH